MKSKYLFICLLFLLFLSSLQASESFTNMDTARQAMVVAARSEAVQAGIEMMHMGGNAVDAAVAAAFVIGVVEPYASGLGGGGGILIYLSENSDFHYLDYYVQAPAVFDTAFSSNRDRETVRSICIPGTPAGLITALQDYGRLSRSQVLQPAIRIARNGFEVNEHFFEATLEKLELILKYERTSASFLNQSLPYMAGDTLRLPELARVLEGIAAEGSDFFYRGEFMKKVVSEIQQHGGTISADDFTGYQVLKKSPVSIDYRNYQIYSAAPPQSGVTLLEILEMVEQRPSEQWKEFQEDAFSVMSLTEIIRRADADRYAFLGDPRFSPVPLAGLLHTDYLRQRFLDTGITDSSIERRSEVLAGDPWMYQEKSMPAEEMIEEEVDAPHTTHISVIDEQGNMVSLTQTLGFFFGSGFSMDGVVFNSGMTNFSRRGINRAEPGKRPRSTISPSIILRESQPFAVLGTPGGGTIFNTMAQLIIRLIDLQDSPQDAVYAPRFSTRVSASNITLEDRFNQDVLDTLQEYGYEIKLTSPFEIYLGGVQLIYYDTGINAFIGVSDPRRGGVAGGF
ncbi:MAG: gamma-glutamyltransferase [Calditrichaeota bacterium]|nr:gamma-glutamyltransferase [Calditrichota bacterium]RQW06611.1 MAG: gamma-glutamyltransferase [Calditrichota bacterium]